MLFQGERGGMEALHFVAVLALVEVRGAAELPGVRVLMAIRAGLERRVIVGIETRRKVALGAGQALVLASERVLGGLMRGFGKRSGLPAGIGMTRPAFAVIGAGYELPFVLILMAIHALVVRDRLLEIGIHVALVAGQPVVLSVQGELSFAVVEGAARDLCVLPTGGVVARFAAGREGSVVRILMAAGARLEIQSFVLDHLGVGLRRLVTLGALHIRMLAGQREMGGRVVKLLDRLPGGEPVTGLAVGAQLAAVMIFVAREAGRMHPLEGLGQIVDHDGFAVSGGDVLGIMAVFAFQLRMLAEQRITSLLMIELLLGGIPLKDAEALAIMLGVAARAIGVALGAIGDAPVHALVRFDELENFAVAVETLQLLFPGAEAMAHGTL